jgi:hypothetical protein
MIQWAYNAYFKIKFKFNFIDYLEKLFIIQDEIKSTTFIWSIFL